VAHSHPNEVNMDWIWIGAFYYLNEKELLKEVSYYLEK
jgi:hypothetical protein